VVAATVVVAATALIASSTSVTTSAFASAFAFPASTRFSAHTNTAFPFATTSSAVKRRRQQYPGFIFRRQHGPPRCKSPIDWWCMN
jgi:hypothetical protein